MTDERLSLDDLVTRSGVEKRTIRSWISLGLLPGPDSLGRNAGYGRVHLDRLKAIIRLRRDGNLSLSEIRSRLQSLADQDIRDLAEGRIPVTPTRGGSSSSLPPSSVRGGAVASPIERAVRRLESAVGRAVPPKAHRETWHRIAISPDVELTVRNLSDADLERLERLADLLREILSGGTAMNAGAPFALTAGFDKGTVWEDGKSERYLVIALQPQASPQRQPQVPLNLALVLDVSGSMSGSKLDDVRRASHDIIRALRECDTLSVVTFASEVHVPLPGRLMDPEGKAAAQRAVTALESRDSTNLSGGWIQGADCVAEQASRRLDTSNFVVLLTDGRANVGITDPVELGSLAATYRRRGINTSAVGVGDDWSDKQIEAIAGFGGGRLYHAESPEEIVTHVLGEFEDIATVIAEDVMLEVEFPPELKPFEHIGTFAHRREGNRLECSLGSLPAASAPRAVFRVMAPAGRAGERLPFTIRARYRTPGDTMPQATAPVTAELVFATTKGNDATPYDLSLALEAAKAWQAVAIRVALSVNREGRYAEAREGLAQTLKRLTHFVREKWKLAAAKPLLDEMQSLLERIGRAMDEGERKRISTEKWKGTRGERDPRTRR